MKRKIKLCVILLISGLLFLINSSHIIAQEDYLFENITVSDGLSSSRFNYFDVIFQDKFGFMWFGTVDGLNRYDGYTFKAFKNIPSDSTSLPSSNILNINEDNDGNLWVGTPGYMSIFKENTNSFINYPLASVPNATQREVQIGRSYVDSKNNFWVGTLGSGLQKWNRETKIFEIVPFLFKVEGTDTLTETYSAAVIGISELKNGNLLIAGFNKGIFFYNEASNKCEEYTLAGNSQPIGIVDIFEDRSGNIWFSGRDALIQYNPITFTYQKIDEWKKFNKQSDVIFFFGINEFEDGSLFLNSIGLGLCKYYPETKRFEVVKIEGELGDRGIGQFPASKFVDNFGVYWIGLSDNGILKFDPKRRPFRFYPLMEDNVSQSDFSVITSLKANLENSDELLIVTNKKGLFKFDLIDREISNLNIKIPSIYSDSSNIRNLIIDDDHELWFSDLAYNISSYNLKTKNINTYKVINKELTIGAQEVINGLEYLPKNNLIISTNTGVKIFNTKTKESSSIPSIANRKYNSKLIDKIRDMADNDSSFIGLTKVGEASNLGKNFTLNETTNILIVCLGEGQYPDGIFDYGALNDEKGKVLWSMNKFNKTFHGGGGFKNRLQIDTVRLKPGNYNLRFQTDVGHSYAAFNVNPPTDSTWYGIQLFKLNNSNVNEFSKLLKVEKETKQYPDFLFSDVVLASRKYPNTIWIGVGNKGIIKYDFTSGKFKQYVIEDIKNSLININQLFEDSKGILWVVTVPSGFYRFDPDKEKFYSNAKIPEIPLTAINSIIEDFQESIWISSSNGITKLIKSKNDTSWSITKYDSKDGVPGGFGRGSIITRGGEILFGSFNGIIAFYPSLENTIPPLPVITNINIAEISILDRKSEINLKKSIFELDNLSLSFAQNDISFDFASLHYSRPSKNRVSYKLEGFNKDWTYTDRNFVSFTNLDPGDYTFKVRAISGYGISGLAERELKIFIAPPWYRTTIAYISYVLFFIGIVFGIDRIQRGRLLSKERERQRIQEAELRALAAEAQSRVMQAENDRKSEELEEARQLQLSMLPRELPQLPHLDIAVYMKTATEVGGDYYDFHIGMDGTLTVVLGDATGHGMKAGTMVTTTKSLFNVLAPNPNIVETFHEMTRCLKIMNLEKLSMCMTMIKIMGNKIQMSAAGMPPVFIYKSESQSIEEHVIKGMPLGTFSDFPYSLVESSIKTGDTILMMSDGFPELFNENKEMFGYKRTRNLFEELATETPEVIITKLKDAGSEWVNNREPDDDVTFVVIKFK